MGGLITSHSNEHAEYPIRIDKDGVWYYLGNEMIRKDIVRHFYENLHVRDGEYVIELGSERCPVRVDDVPYVVKAVWRMTSDSGDGDVIRLLLNDMTTEDLEPSTLKIGGDNVPYCSIRRGRFDARFSRPGYYQLAELIEHDGAHNRYFIALNGTRHYLETPEDYHAKRHN